MKPRGVLDDLAAAAVVVAGANGGVIAAFLLFRGEIDLLRVVPTPRGTDGGRPRDDDEYERFGFEFVGVHVLLVLVERYEESFGVTGDATLGFGLLFPTFRGGEVETGALLVERLEFSDSSL